MTEEGLKAAVKGFSDSAKKVYGDKLEQIILYGSCARGDYKEDSDIDIMVLLNVEPDKINSERKRILNVTDELDLTYDVVLAPVFQSRQLYQRHMPVSVFYQNVQKEGIPVG